MITLEAMGLTQAQEITDFMQAAIAEYAGCYYRGTLRAPDENGHILSNGEVVQSLKDHPKNRDLKTFNDTDAAGFGEVWRQRIHTSLLDFQAKNGSGLKKVYQRMKAYELAKRASARAWREAGQALLARMKKRQAEQISANNTGVETAAAAVSPGYARWRREQYGVEEGRVYIATGQLMEDLSPDVPGRIKLVKGAGAVGRAEAAADIKAGVDALLKGF